MDFFYLSLKATDRVYLEVARRERFGKSVQATSDGILIDKGEALVALIGDDQAAFIDDINCPKFSALSRRGMVTGYLAVDLNNLSKLDKRLRIAS